MKIKEATKFLKSETLIYKDKIVAEFKFMFEPAKERDNFFYFNNTQLLEKARSYLERYERREASKIIQGKKELIFTNQADRPLTKTYEETDTTLDKLKEYLEKEFDRTLTQVEKAYLEWEFYNESEERMIELVIKGIFQIELNKVEKFVLKKVLNKNFKRGEEVFARELEELFGKFNERRLLVYRYIS